MPFSLFFSFSLRFHDHLRDYFAKNEKPSRLMVSMLEEVNGCLDDITDEILLGRLQPAKQANRDMLRALLVRDETAFQAASKACGRAFQRANAYLMSPEDFGKTPPIIFYLGGRRYRLDDGVVKTLGRPEHAVLQAFLKCKLEGPDKSLEQPELIDLSGYPYAPRILKNLKKKFPDTLGLAIHLPGRKGLGGFLLRISAA